MAWPKGKSRTGMKYASSQRTHKICTKCKENKPRTTEFYSFTKMGYPHPRCRTCMCPTGITREMRQERAKGKKKLKVEFNKTFSRRFEVKEQPQVASEEKWICHCCKKEFTPKNKSERIYCSRDCKMNYQDYGRYQRFLGLNDLSERY